jgi:hypothetical protein
MSLLAVLAFGAVVASGAQAEGKFKAGKYPASLTGTGTSANTYTINGREVSCLSSSFTGTLSAESESVQVSPGYGLCVGKPGSTPVSLFMGGCSYTWAVTKLNSPTTATGTQAFSCPAGSEIHINLYENNQKFAEGITLCEWGIPAQGPLGTVQYENQGSGTTASVQLAVNVGSITVNVLKGTKLICGAKAGETTTGQDSGGINLTAKNGGVQTGLSIG